MTSRKLVFNVVSYIDVDNPVKKPIAETLYRNFWTLVDELDECGVFSGPLYYGDTLFTHSGLQVDTEDGKKQPYSMLDWINDVRRSDNVLASLVTQWTYRNCRPDGPPATEISDHIYSVGTDKGAYEHESLGAAHELSGLLISLATDKTFLAGQLRIRKTDILGTTREIHVPHLSNVAHLKTALPINAETLILCEDTKSSIYYLESACFGLFDIPKNRCKIEGLGRQTVRVVEQAIELANLNPEKYHHIFCVFDHDDEVHYDRALELAMEQPFRNCDGEPIIVAIPSNPCYEYWLLLHFPGNDSNAPIAVLPDASVGVQMRRRLQTVLPDYEKQAPDIWKAIEAAGGHYRLALQSARRINRESNNDYRVRPTTAFPNLFDALKLFSMRTNGHSSTT